MMTILTFQMNTGTHDVQSVEESLGHIYIPDMAQKHWIVDLSKWQVILVEY